MEGDRAVWTLTLLENIKAIIRNLEDEDRSALTNYLLAFRIRWIELVGNQAGPKAEEHWNGIRMCVREICSSDGIWGGQALLKSDIDAGGCCTVQDFLREHRLIREGTYVAEPPYGAPVYQEKLEVKTTAFAPFLLSYLQRLAAYKIH
jgi:hypothetical protein